MARESEAPAEEARARAEDRFSAQLEDTGTRDPRDRYRDWLRQLRSRDEAAFRKALDYYESELVPALAAVDSDPLTAWTEYGIRLAQRLSPGSAVRIDATGRSRPYDAATAPDELILHLPRAAREQALPVRVPAQPTPAQHAAFELLVRHSLG
jgi:hypothetical protein